jgi:hypothetical protein
MIADYTAIDSLLFSVRMESLFAATGTCNWDMQTSLKTWPLRSLGLKSRANEVAIRSYESRRNGLQLGSSVRTGLDWSVLLEF